jgi:hypothetical protein
VTNRNARLDRLRALVPVTNAIVGIDLAGKKQMVVVTDQRFEGDRTAGVPVPGLGSWLGAGLGRWVGRGGRLGGGDGVV